MEAIENKWSNEREREGKRVLQNTSGEADPFPWQQCFSHLLHMSKLKIHAVLALIHTQTHTRTLPPWIPLTSSHPHMVTVERKLLHQCKQKQEKPCLALLLLIKSNRYDSSVLIFSLVLSFMYSH